MNHSALPTPSDPSAHRKVSIRRRGAVCDTATSSCADEALRQVLHRRVLKRDGRSSAHAGAQSGALVEFREAVSRLADVRTLLRCAAILVIGLALWGAFTVMRDAPPAEPRHVVQGVLAMNGAPLPHSIVEFHRVAEPPADTSFVEVAYTDDEGRFAFGTLQTPGIPAGDYSIVVRGRRRVMKRGEFLLEPVQLPKPYAFPQATPLKVSVTSDVTGVRLVIRK